MTQPPDEVKDKEDRHAAKALNELISLVSATAHDSSGSRDGDGDGNDGKGAPVLLPPSPPASALQRIIGAFSSGSPLKRKTEGSLLQTTLVDTPDNSNAAPGLSVSLDYRLGKPFPAFKKLEGKLATSCATLRTATFRCVGIDYAVDAFCYGPIPQVKGYFLSHFHADHYAGLNRKFQHGPIYCSKITAHLIDIQLKVAHECIKILPMEQEVALEPGVTVTLLDANHCPGAVMFLFKHEQRDKQPRFILHTGDFRADARLVASLHLGPFRRCSEPGSSLDIVYLDTTYADPQFEFPCQSLVLAELAIWIRRLVVLENSRKLVPFQYLVVVGAYTVGKEKVALAVAQALQSRIHVHTAHQRRIYDMYGWRELHALLDADPLKAQVHIVPMAWLNVDKLSELLTRHSSVATHVIALRPTGWAWSGSGEPEAAASSSSSLKETKRHRLEFPCSKLKYHTVDASGASVARADRIAVYSVPYSEHSSYDELLTFMQAFSIKRIIPTVPSRHNLALLDSASRCQERALE